MEPIDTKEYVNLVKRYRSARKLHPLVQERLTVLLSKIYPNNCTVDEVSLVAGGRNDLISFSFDKRKVVFELFFSIGQVPQDLRLLEQSKAEIKIAILLDREVDSKLAKEYFRKKPDAFSFLWLQHVLDPWWEEYCTGRLRELTDENNVISQMRELLASPIGEISEKILKKQIAQLKEHIPNQKNKKNIDFSNITPGQLASLLIIKHMKDSGIPSERLHSILLWLPKVMPRAFELVMYGFQVFLFTDLKGNHGVYTDSDISDFLFIAADQKTEVNVVICLNEIINKIFEARRLERREVNFHIYHGYHEFDEKIQSIKKAIKTSKPKKGNSTQRKTPAS